MHPAAAALIATASLFTVLLGLALVRTLSLRLAPAPGVLKRDALEAFAGCESSLSCLVRIPTVSGYEGKGEDDNEFRRFKEELNRLYPLTFERLLAVDAGDRAVFLEWPGRSRDAGPVLLASHFDVVPPGEPEAWDSAPFSGVIAEGSVHGRGSLDAKVALCGILNAVELLLSRGFVPERTIFLAFGGDEETGGSRGATVLASVLRERGIRLSFVLDEGGYVASDALAFCDRPVALVGISEKGYMDVAVEAMGQAGSSSEPPPRTAAGSVARAVAALEAKRFRSRMTQTAASFINEIARYAPFRYRFAFRNLWLCSPFVRALLSRDPLTNALIRTTSAATMLAASGKAHALPERAWALLSVRVLPGTSMAKTLGTLDAITSRAGARAFVAPRGQAHEAPSESRIEHEGYRAIQNALGDAFPEAGCAPFMFSAGTDSRHYDCVADAVYRFTPVMQSKAEGSLAHRPNERVSVENLKRCSLFYEKLLLGSC